MMDGEEPVDETLFRCDESLGWDAFMTSDSINLLQFADKEYLGQRDLIHHVGARGRLFVSSATHEHGSEPMQLPRISGPHARMHNILDVGGMPCVSCVSAEYTPATPEEYLFPDRTGVYVISNTGYTWNLRNPNARIGIENESTGKVAFIAADGTTGKSLRWVTGSLVDQQKYHRIILLEDTSRAPFVIMYCPCYPGGAYYAVHGTQGYRWTDASDRE